MTTEPGFAERQALLAACLRDPSRPPPAGMESRRLALYRELFFNNVRDFVETAYPVLKSLLPAAEWTALVQGFYAEHRAQSPYFRDISLEFRQWLEAARGDWLAQRPWATELLHFEWAELAADFAEVPCEPAWSAGDLLDGRPVLRGALWPLAYRWPVHALGPRALPAAMPPPAPTFLLLWRDGEGAVRRREVGALAARLVESLQQDDGRSGREVLAALAAEAGATGAAREALAATGAGLLEELREEGLILGIRCDNPGR